MNTSELWQAVLGELELSLSKANFTTWFRNTFIVSHQEDEVIIGVPNMFTKAWLEKKYHREILQSLQNLTNQRFRSVIYRVDLKTTRNEISRTSTPITQKDGTIISSPQQTTSENIASEIYFPTPSTIPPTTSSPQRFGEFSLNAKYLFNNYVVGKQNELAHAAAQAVSTQPGGVYNPLFIYGGVGLGKTHLLQAIGNELLRKNPQTRVLYVTCERFTNDYINAVRAGHAREFKNHYRNVDLLLVDDIQFITGKEGTQEEFFHTFNQLHQNNKQIVISSDRPPKAIPTLEERLISRFECGMMADIGSPDFETRTAILEMKCREKNYLIERDIVDFISTAVQNNIRELEGALNKVIAFHQFKNIRPTLETVKPILVSFQPTVTNKSFTVRQVIQVVASYFDLQTEDLMGQSREKRFAFPRQIIMYLLREEMKASYPTIGAEIGGRDHTTAMHAYDKISTCLLENEKLQHDIEMIKQKLYTVQ